MIDIEKEYKKDGVVHLKPHDIEMITDKTHPGQIYIQKKFGHASMDDCFCLPQPYMRLIDEAELNYNKGTGEHGKGYAKSTFKISQEDPWFWTHFLGDPIMPGSQGQDAFAQLAGMWGAFSGEISGRARALEGQFKFEGQVFPHSKKLFFHADIIRFLKKKRVVIFDGYLALDKPDNIIYRFGATKVGFFSRAELGIHGDKAKDYYKPDWDKVKKDVLSWVERAEKYYESY